MALFDFLSKYAMEPQQASPGIPAVNDPGGIGVHPAIGATAGRPGMTYGDIASVLMQYGSKPGSSGAMFGQGLQSIYGANAMAQQPGMLQDFGPTAQQQQQQKSMNSAGQVMKFFTSMFGV
jgi:hypothetical protein